MCETLVLGTLTFNSILTPSQIQLFTTISYDHYKTPCVWKLTKDYTSLRCSRIDHLRSSINWLQDIITNFIIPSQLTLNGSITLNITWNDIILNDVAFITVTDNQITSSDFEDFNPELILINWLYNENKRLSQEVQRYRDELDYMPGGQGTLLAQQHFESLISASISS